MANSIVTQTIEDGPKNLVLRQLGYLDTANQAYTILVNPASLNTTVTQGTQTPTKVRLRKIQWTVQDGLAVRLYWDVDGTQANAALLQIYEGRSVQDYHDFGGIPNAAGGANGKVGIDTYGWNTGLILSYTMELYFYKLT